MPIPAFACLWLLMCARLTYCFANSHALTCVNSTCLLYIAWCGVRLSTHLSRVRSHWRTRYGTVMACRVCLTVSSLLPTDGFISTATNCRCFQPAYFPDLHRFGKCLCVTWLLTESRVRVGESVYIICTSMEIQHARWEHSRMCASGMCMKVSVSCLSTFMSMHDSCQHSYNHRKIHMYTHIFCLLFSWRIFGLSN